MQVVCACSRFDRRNFLTTELPIDEIETYESLQGAELNDAKKTLATEVTKLCHGDTAAKIALETSEEIFAV